MKSQHWLLAAAFALILTGAGCARRQPPQAGQPATPAETVSVDGTVDAILEDVAAESSDAEAADVSEINAAEDDYRGINEADYEVK